MNEKKQTSQCTRSSSHSNVNEQLKRLRLSAELSQQTLSDKTGIGVYLIDAIESMRVDACEVLSLGNLSRWKHICSSEVKRNETKLLLSNVSFNWSLVKIFVQPTILKSLVYFTFSIFVVCTFYYIEQNVLLDRIVLGMFILLAVIGRNNFHVFWTSIVFILVLFMSEVIFFSVQLLGEQEKVIFYASLAIVTYKLRHDSISLLVAFALLASVGAELYWYFTDYNPPHITWPLYSALSCIAARFALDLKFIYAKKSFFWQPSNNKHDFLISQFLGMSAILNIFTVAEYLVRHIGGIKIFFVYYFYTYVLSAFALIYIYLLFNQLKHDYRSSTTPL